MSWEILHGLRHSIHCPVCAAEPGDNCVTKSGKRATYAHSARMWPMDSAFWAGYEQAEKDIHSRGLTPQTIERFLNGERP